MSHNFKTLFLHKPLARRPELKQGNNGGWTRESRGKKMQKLAEVIAIKFLRARAVSYWACSFGLISYFGHIAISACISFVAAISFVCSPGSDSWWQHLCLVSNRKRRRKGGQQTGCPRRRYTRLCCTPNLWAPWHILSKGWLWGYIRGTWSHPGLESPKELYEAFRLGSILDPRLRLHVVCKYFKKSAGISFQW